MAWSYTATHVVGSQLGPPPSWSPEPVAKKLVKISELPLDYTALTSYTFGPFRLDTGAAILFRCGEPVGLGPRAVTLLRALVERHSVPVSKDTLIETAWTGLSVEESNLTVQISALRRVLSEAPGGDRWIETLPRRGYRFVGPVVAQEEDIVPDLNSSAEKPSLAVLPFANMSGDPEQECFADGMVEEITTALSRIRWLFVTARNSSFTYKGGNVDAKRFGRELGVRYVLEGSVRRSGDRVRITAQLIDASTGAHLWAHGFGGSLKDVFELQDRVASSVAGAIEPTLEAAEIRRSRERPTADLTSYDLYLRAVAHHLSYEKERLAQALDLLRWAIERDPHYGPALALAAYCHAQLDVNGWTDAPDSNRHTGLDLARRALRVAADDPDVLARAGFLLGHFGEDIDAAIGLLNRALALRPSFARGWFWSGNLRLFAGQPDLAIEHFERCRRLSPRDPVGPRCLTGIATAHFFNRRFDDAINLLLVSLEELSSYAPTYRFLAASYAHLGRLGEASAIVARLRRITRYVETDSRWFRNVENRHLILSGLRRAIGDDRSVETPLVETVRRPVISIDALPSRVAAQVAVPIEHRQAERRQITAVCCELVGSMVDPDGRMLEEWQETVGSFQRCVSEAASRHKGFVYRDLGDSALVLFNYPEAHEHGAEQAIRAGLELCAVVRTLRSDADALTHCRVGIATGLVIVGDPAAVGAARGQSLVGDTPNLAARLASSAHPDTVAVEPATRRLVGDLFDCREVGAIAAADGSEPIRSWQVLGESVVASRFEALRGPALSALIGREDEIDLLLRRWGRARTGEGQVVLVGGEPGIGKSRLAAALGERLSAEPHLHLCYFCSPHRQDSALFPFIDQLGRAAGFARDDGPTTKLAKIETLLAHAAPPSEDVALLADLLSLPASERHPLPNLSPPRKKERLLKALIRRFARPAARQPVVAVFEDAQWADPTSREVLDLAVERIGSLPVLLIVTFRPEFEPPWTGQPQVTMLALNRLSQRNRTTLIEHVAGKALPHDVVAHIAERTDGVPLFIEELTKSVLETGVLHQEPDRSVGDRALPSLAIPTTLQASLQARLDRLASARRVAQIGAAIGRQFPYPLLRAVARLPDDQLQAALARLVASDLAFQRGSPPEAVYIFKHALVQDAAHGSLLRNARRQLHARIAEALEAQTLELVDTEPEIFAQHYAEAGLVEKSIAFWYKAGQRSAARSAAAEAVAQFQKGLDLLSRLTNTPERQLRELQFWSALSAVLQAFKGDGAPEPGGAYARALDLWERLDSPSEFLHVPWGKARYHMYRGEFNSALYLAEEILDRSRRCNDLSGLVLGHNAAGHSLLLAGTFAASRWHFDAALVLDPPISHRSLAQQAAYHPQNNAQAQLGIVLCLLGYPDQALARSSAAIAEARQLGHPPSLALSLVNASALLVHLGDDAGLGKRLEELIAVASEQAFFLWRAFGTIHHGWVEVRRGDLGEGLSLLRRGLAGYRATGAILWLPYFISLLARGYEISGEIEEALTQSDDALQIAESSGERWFAAELYRHKGQLLLQQGHCEVAEDLYYKALRIAGEQEAKLWELRAATSLARLRRDQGRLTEARDLLAPVYGWFTEGFATPDLKDGKTLLDELDA